MCGIFGVRGPHAKDTSLLRAAARQQRHRGPDGFADFTDARGTTYLAHNRLAIIDLSSASNQPFHTPEGVLVFNGEIYNYLEIRKELEAAGARFRTEGDTEVLATTIATWGFAGLHKLRGMFAFAYLRTSDGSLTLGRDRFGIKPLFVAEAGGSVFFASEVETLRALSLWQREDEEAQAMYHLLGYLPPPYTFYENVIKVPPGYLVHLTGSGYSLERWYKLEPRVHGELGALMRRSVAEHMRCDVDYGMFLSSGLDSNIVASLANDIAPGRIRTYSIGFSSFPAIDETAGARLAAAHLGSEHQQLDVSGPEFAEAAETCLAKVARGEPFSDSSIVPTWLVSRHARGTSKVALSGDGADEVFGGYRKHRGIRAAASLRALPRAARDLLQELGDRLPEARDNKLLELSRRLKKFLRGAGQEPHLRQLSWLYTFFPDELDVLAPGKGRDAERRLSRTLLELPALASSVDEVNESLHADVMIFLGADMLHKVDLASMDHSLEVRVPFLDHEVVETAFTLPSSRKVGYLKGKVELRRLFGDRLPPKLLRLPKRGFESPISSLFRGAWSGKLSREAKSLAGAGFSAQYLKKLEEEHVAAVADHSTRLWNLLVLSRWLASREAVRENLVASSAP